MKRYRTAQGLAEDLARYQKNEPILARPTGMLERGVKWARRHPAVAATSTAAAVSVVAIAALVASYTTQLRSTLKDANEQRQRAETQEVATQAALDAEAKRRGQAFAALEKLTGQLTEGTHGGSRDVLDQKSQLEQTLATYQTIAAEAGSNPDQRRAAAGALRQAARIQQSLGRPESLATYDTVVEMMREQIAAHPENPELREFLARTLFERGRWKMSGQQLPGAYHDGRAAAEMERSLPNRNDPEVRMRQGMAWNLAVVAARRAAMVAEADAAEKEAETIWRQLHEEFPDNDNYRLGVAGAYQTRAVDYERDHRFADAEASYRKASEIRTAGGRPLEREQRFFQADCLRAISLLCEKRGDLPGAIKEQRAALVLWEELHAERRNNSIYVRNLVECLTTLIKHTGKSEEFEPEIQRMRRYMATAAVDANSEIVVSFAGFVYENGQHHQRNHRYGEAVTAYSAAIAALQELLERRPREPQAEYRLMLAQAAIARSYYGWKRFEHAVEAWDALVARVKNPATQYRMDRAKALASAGRLDDALHAATEVDLKNDPQEQLKMAAVYALCAAATDGNVRTSHEDEAMIWLKKAHAGGVLKDPSYYGYVKGGADWRALRKRDDFQKLLK